MLAEPLELAIDLFLGLFVLGGFERGLHFLEPGVDVSLAAGEFLEAVGDLSVFGGLLLLLGLLGLGRSLLLEPVLVVLEFELVELLLLLGLAGGSGLLLLLALAGDVELAGLELSKA